ncbi:CocE/NonD family hydrolase [Halarchaeum nitratireducens]|uniref:Xaa-Pro dipeptidyl-peptidase C-terminal domain-containing protein n=1 Tax=Halarchaeum nitratireducens TaxID=489913 RepID=A0A830GDY4_9EURY|nr:CocE/NonD family hydrolase [Halarchaeum nitratireducens]GGN24635.1 hypothetical protein GCM10009021_28060 [Halarchaeum nitratireducens]
MDETDGEPKRYDADDITFIAEEYRPRPTQIDPEAAAELGDVTNAYFDGYPQLVAGEPPSTDLDTDYDGPSDVEAGSDEARLDAGIDIERDVMVSLHDDAELAVNTYRPSEVGDDGVPALLAWGMWGKDAQEAVFWLRDHPQPYQEAPFWDGSLEAGDTPYLVEQGYAHVVPDPRGIGESGGGPVKNLFDLHDAADITDLVEWIADRSWCDGTVGMIGPSSFAFSQAMAGQDPPDALEALFPIAFWFPGDYTFTGMRDTSLYNIFHGGHMYDSTHPLSLDEYDSPMTKDALDDDEFDALIETVTSDPDVKYNPKYLTAFQYPEKDPMAFDLFVNEWFQPHGAPGDISELDMPTYVGGVLPGGAHHRLYWSAFEAWERMGTPDDEKKLIVLPPGELARPWVDYQDEVVRWNDELLGDGETGILDEPAVKTYVMGVDKWTFEHDWPPERTEWTEKHLHADGSLSNDEPDGGDVSWYQPLPLDDSEVTCVTFSETMDEPLELIGPIALHLEAAIDDEDTNWIVDLVDVGPDGERQLVSQGWLRASYSGLDEDASMRGWPIHTTEQTPVNAGEIRQYDIAMAPTAAVIEEGHELRLVVRNQDDMTSQLADRGVYFLPLMRDVTHTIETDGGSYLDLPVTGRGDEIRDRLDNGAALD